MSFLTLLNYPSMCRPFLLRALISCIFVYGWSCPVAIAEPAFGVGFSYVPGTGWTVGLKALSDNEEHSGHLSIGIDYVISRSRGSRWRPNVGAGYQSTSVFDEINLGYFESQLNVGLSVGYVNNEPAPFRKPKELECEPNCVVDTN